MEDDAKLKELFKEYNPKLGDDKAFLDSLQKRMRVVKIVQQSQKSDTHLSKLMLVVAFVLGVLSTILVMMLCDDINTALPPLKMFGTNLLLLNVRVIMLAAVAMMMSVCIIFIVSVLYGYLRQHDNRFKTSLIKDL